MSRWAVLGTGFISNTVVDAIYIGLPNHQHHGPSIAAAAAGKAVLSEKSLTTTMEDATGQTPEPRMRNRCLTYP